MLNARSVKSWSTLTGREGGMQSTHMPAELAEDPVAPRLAGPGRR